MAFKRPVVFLGQDDWTTLKQRPHHLAEGLSRHRQVIYIDPTSYSFLTFLVRQLRGAGNRRRLIHAGGKRLTENLTVFTPPAMLPFGMFSLKSNRWNQQLLYRLCRSLLPAEFILWCNFPLHYPFVPMVSPAGLVYDCWDNWPYFYRGRRRRLLSRLEGELVADADLVLTSSPPLLEKCESLAQETLLVPNGVSEVFFKTESSARPADLPEGQILGFVGGIDHWFNWSWIRLLTEHFPKCRIVLIGPLRRKNPILRHSNVHYLGEKNAAAVPAYLDHFNVGLIPFQLNELTDAAHPLKLLEYFSRGLPVVAPPMRGIEAFQHQVHLASDQESLVRAVSLALADQEKAGRRETAKSYRWTLIAEKVERLLQRFDPESVHGSKFKV